jgi:RimJ/RimL family protein N-acetyltransferase
LGIRLSFRRRGYATAAIRLLADYARQIVSGELLVYTGFDDQIAQSFYTKVGFELVGPAREHAPGKTMDHSDIVLRPVLAGAKSAGG